jgi:hypothetical protein
MHDGPYSRARESEQAARRIEEALGEQLVAGRDRDRPPLPEQPPGLLTVKATILVVVTPSNTPAAFRSCLTKSEPEPVRTARPPRLPGPEGRAAADPGGDREVDRARRRADAVVVRRPDPGTAKEPTRRPSSTGQMTGSVPRAVPRPCDFQGTLPIAPIPRLRPLRFPLASASAPDGARLRALVSVVAEPAHIELGGGGQESAGPRVRPPSRPRRAGLRSPRRGP